MRYSPYGIAGTKSELEALEKELYKEGRSSNEERIYQDVPWRDHVFFEQNAERQMEVHADYDL